MQDKKFPQRKNFRLKDFDYSSNNFYFVTICVKDKKQLLSKIVGDDESRLSARSVLLFHRGCHRQPAPHIVPRGARTVPKKIILKPYGEIAEKHILRINTMYQNAYVEKYIIMPNHIHMLIFIDRYEDGIANEHGADFGNGTMKASSPTSTDLSTVIRTFKTMVTKEIGTPIWQRSFYDEIIKSETHFQNVWNYIAYNALKEYSA